MLLADPSTLTLSEAADPVGPPHGIPVFVQWTRQQGVSYRLLEIGPPISCHDAPRLLHIKARP